MEGVIKSDGLGGLVSHPGVFWSEVVGHPGNDASRHHCQTDKDLDGQPVGVAGENIGHELKRGWIKWDKNRAGYLLFKLDFEIGDFRQWLQESIRSIKGRGVVISFLNIWIFPLNIRKLWFSLTGGSLRNELWG